MDQGIRHALTKLVSTAVKLLGEGLIGTVKVAKCWNIQRRGSLGRGQDTSPPAGLDYDNWVGPATMIPYRSNRVHNRWTMWYHFGTGDMGNDGVHDIDRLSQHYSGVPHRDRERDSWTAIVEVRRWHAWGALGRDS